MNILLLPSAYAPAVGGVEVLTARLAHHLQSCGHEIEVWTGRSEGDDLPADEEIDGVRVRRFVFTLPRSDFRALLALPGAAASTLRHLRSAASEFGPDVLHVQCFSGNGTYATALSRLTGVPLVITLQGETVMDDQEIYERSMALRTSLRIGLRSAAAVTGCSAFTLKDACNRFGLDMRKAQVVFNGVDVNEITPVPVILPFKRYILGLGRVVRKKGFDLLLDAFSLVSAKHPNVGLVIAGEGAERESLRRRALDLGLPDRLHLPGALDRGEVSATISGAEVLVMPSRVEPFGIVTLEGWRAGVPVVVTPHGGPPEFVKHGVTGLIADPFDPAGLGSALDSLLASRKLRASLARSASEALSAFSWGKIAARYEVIYSTSIPPRRTYVLRHRVGRRRH